LCKPESNKEICPAIAGWAFVGTKKKKERLYLYEIYRREEW
jgi:hypothetical protein